MISVVVFGRNDQHGYNSHRRVALSLNSLAEVLDGRDEIVFVDYASPTGLPTLPEAIADTLGAKCRRLLRVIKVPLALHLERVGQKSRLPVCEPIARNVGVRRVSEDCEWVLNTNTDMILVPRDRRTLAAAIRSTSDHFLGIPRYEIPEWFWESLDRTDGAEAIATIRDHAAALHLDQSTTSHKWIRFDAPGDFQLVRRELLEKVCGFDERMIHGWHVDSNLSRRIGMAGSPMASLEEVIAGYHMNHNRVQTLVALTEGEANSLERFYYEPDGVSPPGQDSWGLHGEQLDEISLVSDVRLGRLIAAASSPVTDTAPPKTIDARDQVERLSYDPRHALPFVLDAVVTAQARPKVGYLGAGSEMLDALRLAVCELGGEVIEMSAASWSEVDICVIDCGLGSIEAPPEGAIEELLRAVVPSMRDALNNLVSCAGPPELVVVNGCQTPMGALVGEYVDIASVSPACNVSAGRARAASEVDPTLTQQAERKLRWDLRDRTGCSTGRPTDSGLVFSAEIDPTGWGDGWAAPTEGGVRTSGNEATVSLSPMVGDRTYEGSHLAIGLQWTASEVVPRGRTLDVECFLGSDPVWSGTMAGDEVPTRVFTKVIGPSMPPGDALQLTVRSTLHGSNEIAGRTDDHRPNGPFLRLFDLRLLPENRLPLKAGERVEITEEPAEAIEFLDGWDRPEPNGVWMRSKKASLLLWLSADHDASHISLGLNDIRPQHAESKVSIRLESLPEMTFDASPGENEFSLPVRDTDRIVKCELRVEALVTPSSLGLSGDSRELGLFLTSVSLNGD